MGGYRFLAPSWASPCVAFPFMSPPQFQGEYVVLQARNGLRVAFGWLKQDRYYYYHQRLCRTAINFFFGHSADSIGVKRHLLRLSFFSGHQVGAELRVHGSGNCQETETHFPRAVRSATATIGRCY